MPQPKTLRQFMSEDNEFWSFLTLAALGAVAGAVGGVLTGSGAATGAKVGAAGSAALLLTAKAAEVARAGSPPKLE